MKELAVIFDMDGVICHTNPYHSKAFQHFFAKRKLYPTEEEFAQHMYGKTNSYIFKHFLGREVKGQEFIELEEEKEGLFRKIYAPIVDPISGYLEFLNDLKAAGFKTGVATSAPKANMELIIGKLGLASKMESFMASEDVNHHKPEPEIYLKTADKLSVHPAQCVVFEDSYSGVSAAINAGMKVVGVLSSHTREELPPCQSYIENYHEINVDKVIQLISK